MRARGVRKISRRRIALMSAIAASLLLISLSVAHSQGGRTTFISPGDQAPPNIATALDAADAPESSGTSWDHPLGQGSIDVDSVAAAKLAFYPDEPSSPGSKIETDGNADSLFRQIAWVYDNPTFVVTEQVGFQSQSELEQPLSQTQGCTVSVSADGGGYSTDCNFGAYKLLLLHGKTRAILDQGSSTDTVRWLEPVSGVNPGALDGQPENATLIVTVSAPAGELTVDQLTSLAEMV